MRIHLPSHSDDIRIFYKTYKEEFSKWLEDEDISKSSLGRIHAAFKELDSKDQETIIYILLLDVIRCYRIPDKAAREAEIEFSYLRKLSQVKINFIRVFGYLMIGILVFGLVIAIASILSLYNWNIVDLIKDLATHIGIFGMSSKY